jgi:hypothetical protein
MLNLKSTDLLSLITSAAATVDVVASWVDTDAPVTPTSNMAPDTTPTAITTATTTTIVAAPASGVRNVKEFSIRNRHASTATDVTVQLNRSATLYEKFKCALLAGEELTYREGVWFHFDAYGGVYSTQPLRYYCHTVRQLKRYSRRQKERHQTPALQSPRHLHPRVCPPAV